MPKFKLKTHKASAKRIRVTPRGKLLHAKGSSSHLKMKKSRRARKAGRRSIALPAGFARHARKLLKIG